MDDKQQELIYKFSMFEQQIQQIQQQIQIIEQSMVEMNSLMMGMDELIGSKGKEILAPIGRGIFTKTKLLSEELIVDIGEKNFVKKSIPDTKKLIKNQILKLEKVRINLNQNLEEIGQELTQIMQEAQEYEANKGNK
ncbi:MAG: prefoldin subunit alpha [Nanoarchaeota archaeon]|nr:prefoldin subunit alpha [Nanoarchaeota archaeon]MBU4116769.1 prefoldin subunit alpha [Nanoarchaeota archaeon]